MAASQVLDILEELQADILRNAAPLPLKKDAQPEWQGLGFQLGGVRLASALGEVSEILAVPRITVLPGVKEWVLGVANIRGRLMPVIDLHRYLGLATTTPRVQWRLLVVEEGDLVVGLVIEQSLGMQHFFEEGFEQSQPEGLELIQPFVRGAYRHGGRIFYVVSLKALIRDDRFFEVAAETG